MRGADLKREIEGREWYHTIELAPGITTPGWFDTRSVTSTLPLPASLRGKRCLDVGTFDGYWAFEMERRGADEVVAIDVLDPARWDWPAGSRPETVAEIGRRKGRGEGFEIAKRCLGSSVERLDLNVYDLDEDAVGKFDFVYLGSLLVHLRDPVRALSRIRSVCEGQILVVDGIDPMLSIAFPRKPAAKLDGRGWPWWWTANPAGIERMLLAAGFRPGPRHRIVFMPAGRGQPVRPAAMRTLLGPAGWKSAFKALKGDPHAVVEAVPAEEPQASATGAAASSSGSGPK